MSNLTEFGESQIEWMEKELHRRAEQMDKEIPRPFGLVDVPEDDQVKKYIEFRTLLENGDMEAVQAVKEQFGLKELAEDIIRVDGMFRRRVGG